jgi:CHAT domain-containing protein
MQRQGSARRRPWVASAAAGAAFLSCGGAQAALTDRLCVPGGGAVVTSYPSTSELQQAARSAETRLARRGSSVDPYGEIAPALDLPGSATERPSPAALAEYCMAAGELMRVSAQGSQLQAQTYLLAAFQTASAAGLNQPASRAAYRLGLVSMTGSTVAGTRGGRRGTRGTRAAVEEVREQAAASTPGSGPCDLLRNTALLINTNLGVSAASLACAAEQARLAGDVRTAALADLRLARLRLSVAESDAATAADFRAQAAQAAASGLETAHRLEDPALRAEVLGRLAQAALDADGLASAAAVSRAIQGIRVAQPESSSAQAFAAALAARLAFLEGDLTTARGLMDSALLAESQRDLPARLPEWRLLLAEMDPANREAHVLAAYDALEAIRPLLPRFDPLTEETAFSLYMRGVFQSAVDVQLAGAEGQAELVRVRDAQQILEAYRQAELQSVFGSECIPAREPLTPESLRAGEVLLYPILLPDRLELLYVTGGDATGARFRRLPPNRGIDRQTLSRLVETAVLSLTYGEDENWKPASRQLYEILIKPIEGELTEGSLLAVVPDGALRSLPFAMLLDDQDRYLVQRSRVAIAPALAYSQAGGGQDEGLGLLAASLEMDVRVPAGYFERLEGTANEAKVAAVADGQRVERARLLENFKKDDLIQALTSEQVNVLHLATHASFNGRSDRAFIVANGEVILLSELRQILSANRTRGDELDLLVLSACETAVGDDEASMGLAGAAVQAGAKSAIASLWPVNDIGTAELMKTFYRLYREGRSKSQALREAQLALIDGGGMNASPGIWAAFTLLGAWR